MNKCRLCQQMSNNLTKVYSNRIKKLANIVLKLKGFKDSLDINHNFQICETCKQGMESVSIFWENIPEAKPDIFLELHKQRQESLAEICVGSQDSLPAITLSSQEQCENQAFSKSAELEPIKIKIKLPRKRKRKHKTITTSAVETESLPKRVRRCPKRYEDFDIASNVKTTLTDANSNVVPDMPLEKSLQVAILRLANGLDVGQLVQIDSKGISCRFRIICGICQQIFNIEKIFRIHLKTHKQFHFEENGETMNNYLFHCKLCDKSFLGHYAVRRHFRHVHSEERPLKCQYCDANFKYKFNFDYHMAKHVPKTRFECIFCEKKFLKRYELQIHIRTHTKERPYKCEFCSSAFAHRSNLKTHQRNKHFKDSTNLIACKDIEENKFIPPQELLEEDSHIDINDKPTFEDNTSNLKNGNIESNFSETEDFLEKDVVQESIEISTNENNILEISETNAACRENRNTQHKFLPSDINEMQTFEDNTRNLDNENIESNFSETENFLEKDVVQASIEISTNENNILEISETNETCTENRNTQHKLRTFELDSSIIKFPPSDINEIQTFKDNTRNLNNENIESNFSETENFLEKDVVQESIEISTNENNILQISKANEACNENLNTQHKLRTFKIDSSILKFLPSVTVLDLKKWPKSFQSSTPKESEQAKKSCLNNENSFSHEIGNAASNNNKNDYITTEDPSQPIKSVIKYKPLGNNFDVNAVTNYITSLNIAKNANSITSFNSSILNVKAQNFEVSCDDTLKKYNFTNISNLSEPFSPKRKQEYFNDIKLNETADNKFESTKRCADTETEIVSLESGNSRSWKVIKVSAKPIKIKNILNLKTSTCEDDTASKNSNQLATDDCLTFLQTNSPQIKTTRCLTNIQTPSSNINTFSNTEQSLLKPVLNAQQTSNLDFTNSIKKQTVLSAKPIITKIDILPPLNTLEILQKSSLITNPTHLVKPPNDYKHQCPYCYKYLKQKSALTKHIRIHTGEKPYKCTLCSKSYADASNYKKHKMLHKNAAEALNISGTTSYVVQHSPAYSTVSDPDPDGLEVMQTLNKFECSSTEDDASTSSNTESQMWHNALEHALKNYEIRENIRRNIAEINNAILPKEMVIE